MNKLRVQRTIAVARIDNQVRWCSLSIDNADKQGIVQSKNQLMLLFQRFEDAHIQYVAEQADNHDDKANMEFYSSVCERVQDMVSKADKYLLSEKATESSGSTLSKLTKIQVLSSNLRQELEDIQESLARFDPAKLLKAGMQQDMISNISKHVVELENLSIYNQINLLWLCKQQVTLFYAEEVKSSAGNIGGLNDWEKLELNPGPRRLDVHPASVWCGEIQPWPWLNSTGLEWPLLPANSFLMERRGKVRPFDRGRWSSTSMSRRQPHQETHCILGSPHRKC